jgi:hypothetical protein
MTTKYIVNNASGQIISEINSTTIISDTISATTYSNLPIPSYISSGPSAPGSAVVANDTDVDINFSDGVGTAWSFSTTGMTFPDDTVQTTAYEPKYKVYTALLTQIGGDDLQTISAGTLVVGVTYEITNIQTGDDFTNVGASSNTNGVKFVATGTTPTIWTNSSELSYNNGAPVVTVLENTIGNIWFTYNGTGGYHINSDGLFTVGKSAIILGGPTWDGGGDGYFSYGFDGDSLGIITNRDFLNNFVNNGSILNTFLEIRVYN